MRTPIKREDIEKLNVGEEFYLDGTLITCRDAAHRRFLEERVELPVNVRDSAVFHAGPIVNEKRMVVSIGPTTSMRLERYEYDFIERTGVRLIIGKGAMGRRTEEACMKFGAVHAVFPGGCGVYAAERVEAVEGVEWLDLGMPEALWILRVKDFGPLTVSIDSRGRNLFREIRPALFRDP
jgi:L(+)-tartrate dehydratase beta subunit